MLSKARAFSHIYVEEAAKEHPRTQTILKRFSSSTVVVVDDYQNVFGRGRQDFWKQKASPKLILAKKKENFIYPGNTFLQGNISPNFAYNALVLNCPYDCHYCYLQGMYNGANMVAFVNLEDYFSAAAEACANRPDPSRPMPLAISYDTDLLALEGILGYAREWVEWVREQRDLLIEIRTKSAPVRFIEEVEPSNAVRLAWTLSPEEVQKQYESGTPSLEKRISALKKALERGWKVRICIDPVLRVPGWEAIYGTFGEQLKKSLPWELIEQLEIGVFRVTPGYFKKMKKRPGTDLLHYPYEHAKNTVSYKKSERESLVETILAALSGCLSNEQIYTWI